MRRTSRFSVLTMLTLLVAIPGLASLIAPPPNLGTLARISRTVVFAEALDTRVEVQGQQPYTVTAFRVLENVSGERVESAFEVQEMGGVVGDMETIVVGVPKFEKGGRYLLFLDPAAGGRWRTKMMAYGVLREAEKTGVLRPVPEAAELSVLPRPGVEPVGTYRKEALLGHLAAVAQGTFPWSARSVAAPELASQAEASTPEEGTGIVGAPLHNAPAACVFITSNATGRPVRWFGFENNTQTVNVWHTTPGQIGIADGGVSAVQEGTAVWANHENSAIKLQYAGSRARTIDCSDNSAYEGLNEVIFNDPCEQLTDLTVGCSPVPGHWSSPCCGQLGFVQLQSNIATTGQHDGEQWQPIQAFSMVVNNGAQCVGELDFKEVLAHNVGHMVGFWHHSDQNATMYGQLGVHASRGATLAQTDLSCAQYAYHTFLDVPYSRWSWPYVEAIENKGITNGCGGGNYCLTTSASRAEMAVFLIRGKYGAAFVPPPATGTVFEDVPATFWAAPFIEKLFADGLTKGCSESPPRYCPSGQVSRAEMAAFLVRVTHGVDYVPPPATGVFTDVPTSHWAAGHIEQVYHDGFTNGCNASPLRYCPANNVLREEMAAFLSRAYALPLPQ